MACWTSRSTLSSCDREAIGPTLQFAVFRIPKVYARGSRNQLSDDVIVDSILDKYARTSDTALARVGEHPCCRTNLRAIKIGICEDDLADFPPASQTYRFIPLAAATPTVIAASVLPVNDTMSTAGCSTRVFPTSAPPGTTLNAPAGTPAWIASSATRSVDAGAASGGFTTIEFPDANVSAILHAPHDSAPLNGVIDERLPRLVL